MKIAERIYVADDRTDWTDAERRTFYERLAPLGVGIKYEALIHQSRMFAWNDRQTAIPTTSAMIARTYARQAGIHNIFYDAKLHGNPDFVASASRMIGLRNDNMFTVHASMPRESLEAAWRFCGSARPCGVTVLTSIERPECREIYHDSNVGEVVCKHAQRLFDARIPLILCSGLELRILTEQGYLTCFEVVVTGIREENGCGKHDQRRVTTLADAVRGGASHFVIGRPITEAPDPIAQTKRFIDIGERARANLTEV